MRGSVKAEVWLAAIAAAALLLWWAMPRIIETYAAHILESRGLTLRTLDLPRQYRFPIRIDRVEVQRADTAISASGIVIRPFTKDTFSVTIDTARIDSRPAASTTSWRQLLNVAGAPIPAILPRGDITHIEWCSDHCISASAHWLRSRNGFNVAARVPNWPKAGGVWVLAAIRPARARFNVLGMGSVPYLVQGRFDWSRDALEFTVDAHLDAGASPLPIRLNTPMVLALDVRHVNARAEGKLPIDAPADLKGLRETEAAFSVDTDASWLATGQGFAARGGQPLALHGEYRPGHAAIRLDRAITSRIQAPGGPSSSLTIGAASGCDLQGRRVDCELQKGDMFGIRQIDGTATIDLHANTAQGRIEWQGPATDLARVAAMTGLSDFNILSGNATANADVAFDYSRKALKTFHANVALRNGNLTWSGYALAGVDFNASVAGWPHIRSTAPASLVLQEVNIGVPIKGVSVSFSLDASTADGTCYLRGGKFSATTLGGSLSSRDFAFDVRSQTGHLNLDIQGIRLGELLALEQEQLEGTGQIGGSVPIQISHGKLNIHKGKISAAPPGGTIRYNPNETVKSMVAKNAQLKLVTDVMSDFRYDSLTSDIDYSPNGKLTARTSLKGNNPQYENGREIHFNLKLEENVGTLLKSLRLDNEVTRRIEEKVKKATQSSPGVQP